jgi:epoxide hydrolase 4
MKRLLKIMGIILGSALAIVILFVFIFAPVRARVLTSNQEKFRQQTKQDHDKIDSRFAHFYKTAGGVNWHYIEAGNPDGEAILLVHGLPEGYYSWEKVIPLLDQNYRIIAIDMKGYGRSTSADTNYEWHHVADQTLALMDAIGVKKFNVVGHDWGAIITSMMVGDHPERILSYTRMEANLFKPENAGKQPQWNLFKNSWIGNYVLSDAKWFINTVYNGKRMTSKLSEADRNYFIYEFSRPGVSEATARYFLEENRDFDALFDKIAYNNFPFPVMQLQADHDPAQPIELFKEIPERCKNVSLTVVENAGHFSNLDQPQQVADAINELVHGIHKSK